MPLRRASAALWIFVSLDGIWRSHRIEEELTPLQSEHVHGLLYHQERMAKERK